MDRLTLTVYAEHQPARAMKWWMSARHNRPGAGWSSNCWCAMCSSTLQDVSAFATASAADYTDVDYCNRCHVRLEFNDNWT